MNVNECLTSDDGYSYYNNYDGYSDPVYDYYCDYHTSDSPGFTSELAYCNAIDENHMTNENQPQPSTSHAEQDFQEISILKKQR